MGELSQPMASPPAMGGRGMAGPGMAMALPGQMMMVNVMSGMDHLSTLGEIHVQEKANLLQDLTAILGEEISMANRYNILDNAGNSIFYAVEKTDCCKRQLQTGCCHDCAPWEVDLLYTPIGAYNQRFLAITRPFKCVCCCLNRPTADVIDVATQQKIGSFRDPCTCCNPLNSQIRDAAGNDVMHVHGGCCQCGIWCPLPCGPCAEVKFKVRDAQTGQKIARISKRVPSCLKWCLSPETDNYHVHFDSVQHPQWKAMLLAFTIFMDFRYFNVSDRDDAAHNAIDRRLDR